MAVLPDCVRLVQKCEVEHEILQDPRKTFLSNLKQQRIQRNYDFVSGEEHKVIKFPL